MHIELETARLKLRRWSEDDLDPLHGFYRDPLCEKVYGAKIERHEVWRRIATFLGHWQLRGFGLWALEERRSGDFVGYSGLWYPCEFADVEVGWGLLARHRGRGYAQEAASRALDHGYNTLGLERLVSYVRPGNAESVRVAKRLGARPAGEFNLHGKRHIVYLHPKLAAQRQDNSTRENHVCR